MGFVQTVNDFDKLLVQVTEETIKYCLGDVNTAIIWNYMEESNRYIGNMGNRIADPNWHWGEAANISKLLGKTIPSMHCGLTYVTKSEFADKFFESTREIFINYDRYGCKRFFRGARTEEGIFAIAYAKLGMSPIGYTEFPIMSFNYDGDEKLPSVKQVLLDENNRIYEHGSFVPFLHMFEKMEGTNYQKLFNKIMKEELHNIFVITSSVGTKFGKVSIEDRYKQTLKTIDSIREKVKNSIILFIDVSLEESDVYLQSIKSKVDVFVECSERTDDIDKHVCDFSTPEAIQQRNSDRSIPELLMLYKAFSIILNKISLINIDRIFKISGRYYLTDDFDITDYDNTFGKYVFLKSPIQSYPVFECRFWSMSKTNIHNFLHLTNNMLHHLQNQGNNMEHVFKRYINPEDIIEFDKINVEGILAFDGRNVKE